MIRITAEAERQKGFRRTREESPTGCEGRESLYRQAFRMNMPNDMQRELSRQCGDRSVIRADFDGTAVELGYPCTLELPAEVIDAAAQSLRTDPILVRYLRLRIADLETRRGDLARNQKLVFDGLEPE